MKVRAAQTRDLDALGRMRAALWPDGTFAEHRAEAMEIVAGRPRSTLPLAIFVAEDDAGVVGFVEVGLRSHAEGCDPSRPVGFVEGWWVEEASRRRGVGGALVAAAEDWARGQGCTEMASNTWLDHTLSIEAHQALGYEIVERNVSLRKSLET